jgi:tRNA-guanine family transglycosylase
LNGRLGTFSFEQPIQTPFLFPVAFLMTGTTARGGATWKYILQDQAPETKQHTLMRRNSPLLSQVLHFLDYRVSPASVQTWRKKSIKGLYNEQIEGLNYKAPLFLDSGGFKLMWRTGLDLRNYGISLEEGQEAESILKFQKDLGGDMIATLDYPLPPNLLPDEAKKRMNRSLENALQTARLLREDEEFRDYNPFLYMAVHGLTPEAITDYVQKLFATINKENLGDINFGLAIGSLVPLRKDLQKKAEMISIIRAAISAVPEEYKHRVPIHIFGTTGLLVPFLAYLGVDTFDSSTFIQEARGLKYLQPQTFQRRNILEMAPQDIICDCSICRNMDLHELKTSLVSETAGKLQASGYYKSKYYADIALHNFELDLDVLRQTRSAIQAESLDDYLIEMADSLPRMKDALTAIAIHDLQLRVKATRCIQPIPQQLPTIRDYPVRYISLKHTPDDFNINADGYRPRQNKPILLIVPCSREKPYSESHSHKFLSTHLEESIPNWQDKIDKVTLSGLYGPVPYECEAERSVLEYDFRLSTNNKNQIEECTNRLVQFLERHGEHYEQCIAYGTSNAYRTVFDKTAKQYIPLKVFPTNIKSRRLTEFFRKTNIDELLLFLLGEIGIT